MQPGHLPQLYRDTKLPGAAAARIQQLANIADQLRYAELATASRERQRFTRTIDAAVGWVRDHLPAVHWIGAALYAALLFLYCRLVGLTARLVTAGATRWPDLPAPCVLALWHGSAPSFLCAIARKRPEVPIAIMVSRDPRGDSLALLCRFMGLRVARGDSLHRGWEALAEMSAEVERGACAFITPDGGGPARFAKPGAVVLAAAAGVPLVALGADCAPALAEPHKWDAPRNPLPFGRIAVALSEPLDIPPEHDVASLEACRQKLQQGLESIAFLATKALAMK